MIKAISILAVNAGSSSIKLGLFSVDEQQVYSQSTVTISGIGQTVGELRAITEGKDASTERVEVKDHADALGKAVHALGDEVAIDAIAHRIVHGGTRYIQPARIDDAMMTELEQLTVFDPRHMPAALAAISALQKQFPDTPQVASFDTSLFTNLPMVAQLTTLPRKYQALGLRRYGFHGLSYQYLLGAFAKLAGERAANGRVIIAHLGSGSSITAFHGGLPIETTMGFSPASGIPMSTRSGDIDPGIVAFLRSQGVDGEVFDRIVNEQSGLLGVSELSADMLTLLQQASINTQAAEAVELFCYQARKSIGALAAVLGGVDSIIFSGGIGERAPLIRARICAGLGYLGVDIDDEPNAHHAGLISSAVSKVGVHVIPTDEAQVLCHNTYQVIMNPTMEQV
ncbi:MAG: acetate/propionate family kinase [Candidatus Saccharimonas sp.]